MAQKFQVRITEMDGSAFCDVYTGKPDHYCRALEVSRMLKGIGTAVENGATYGACIDTNGNKVGNWCFSEE